MSLWTNVSPLRTVFRKAMDIIFTGEKYIFSHNLFLLKKFAFSSFHHSHRDKDVGVVSVLSRKCGVEMLLPMSLPTQLGDGILGCQNGLG